MGRPVVHSEIIGTDVDRLRSYCGELFGWQINAENPIRYGLIEREQNLSPEGVGIGGGLGAGPEGYEGHVTIYVEVPDVEATLAQAERLGGSRLMGPEKAMEGVEVGLLQDPEGHTIGLVPRLVAARRRGLRPPPGPP